MKTIGYFKEDIAALDGMLTRYKAMGKHPENMDKLDEIVKALVAIEMAKRAVEGLFEDVKVEAFCKFFNESVKNESAAR